MRSAIPFALLALAACSKPETAVPSIPPGTYAGGGRDAMCIAGPAGAQRAGFVVYGAGEANCSASGRIDPVGAGWALVPAGEGECRISFTHDGVKLTLGAQAGACAYYCGPGARLDGKTFERSAAAAANDLAGDPLC